MCNPSQFAKPIDPANAALAQAFMEGVQFERQGKLPYADPTDLLVAIVAAVRIEGSQKKAAKVFGISPQYLSDIINLRREIPDRVARHFGVRRVVRYEKVPDAPTENQ